MPIDPNISLQVKPLQLANPLEQYATAQQIQHAQSQNRLADLAFIEKQQKTAKTEEQNKLLSMLFPNGVAQSGDGQVTNPLGQLNGVNLNVLARLAASGYDTKNLFEIAKYANDGIKLDPNTIRRNPLTGTDEYIPDVKSGFNYDPVTKTVTALKGYEGTNARIKGAETAAVEGNKLLPLNYVGRDGRPIGGTIGEYLGNQAPQKNEQQPAQPPMPLGMQARAAMLQSITDPEERQSFVNAVFNSFKGHPQADQLGQMWAGIAAGGSPSAQSQGYTPPTVGFGGEPVPKAMQQVFQSVADSRDPEKLGQLYDWASTKISAQPDGPRKQAAQQRLLAEVQKIQQSWILAGNQGAQTGRPQLQSDAEREAQVGGVKVQNAVEEKRLKDQQERVTKDSRLYQQLTAAIPMARNLLKEATGSGAGALADQAMAFFGKSTKGAQAAQALDTIGGWMTANVPRMEGPQSNIDVLNYQTMAARVADRTQPTAARLAALDVLEQLQKKYAQVNGVATSDAAAGANPSSAPSGAAGSIPDGAIKMLKANPSLRSQFEAKYGPGSAASILGK